MAETIKGFQTLQGEAQYDYGALANKPDIDGKISAALDQYKVNVDATLKKSGEAADAAATGEKIAQAINSANTYTDEQLQLYEVEVDKTLTQEDQAADAAATGAAITNILTEAKVYTDEQLSNYKIDVDSEIDDSSENPVQNKVIAAEIANVNTLANTALKNATTAQATANENAEKLLTFKYGLTKLPSIRTWRDVAYGDGKFIAVAEQSDVAAYSTDGITWVEVSLPSTANWSSITYGNGMFVAVARGSKTAAYSTDGIHWELSELPSSIPWVKVVRGNDIFVAIAYYSAIAAYSTDGVVWQKTTLTKTNMWNDLAFGNGVFVAVASDSNTINYSTDGINWNSTILDSSVNLQTVTYGNGKFVAMIHGFIKALYSADGISWEETKLPTSGGWQTITYANDRFVCVAAHNEIVIHSTDGINWEESTMPNSDYWIAIEYGNGKFVAITRDNDTTAYSIDGITWKRDYANFIQNEVDITEDIRTLLLEETLGEEIVQADWNQNDESAADYVKNRTHYEEMLLEGEFYNGTPSYVGGSGYDDLPYFYRLPYIETDQLYPLKQFSLKVSHSLYGEGEKEVLANTRYKTTWGPTRTFMITVQSVSTGVKYLLSIAIYCSVSSSENIIMSDLVMANTIPEKYIPPTFVRTDVTNNLQAQVDSLTPEQIGARPDTWMPTAEEVKAYPVSVSGSAQEMQTAINVAAETGLKLTFWQRVYEITEPIVIPSNSDIDFNGVTIKRKTGSGAFDMVTCTDASNVKIRNLVIDGNKDADGYVASTSNGYGGISLQGVTNAELENIEVFGTVNKENTAGIYLLNCENVVLRNIKVHHNDRTGVLLWTSTRVKIVDAVTNDNSGSGISSYKSPECEYHRIEAGRNGYSSLSVNGVNCIVDNVVVFDTAAGFAGLNIGHAGQPVDGTVVSNVQSYRNGLAGIFISDGNGVMVTNADVRENTEAGIRITNGSDRCIFTNVRVHDNPAIAIKVDVGHHKFVNCSFVGNSWAGMNVAEGASVEAYGCTFANNTKAATSEFTGGVVLAKASASTFVGCEFYDDQETATQRYGIVATSTGHKMIGCKASGNILDGFYALAGGGYNFLMCDGKTDYFATT